MRQKKMPRLVLFWLSFGILPKTVSSMILSGPINASTVTVTGNVTVSSMTVSSMTIGTFDVRGNTLGMPGSILQTKFSLSTQTTTVASTTFTAVSNIAQSITLSNNYNYVRISLSGNLRVLIHPDSPLNTKAHITIFRDSTNLGDTSLGLAALGFIPESQPISPVGIRIIDSPGDTNAHTYQVFIRTDESADSASFPYLGPGYLLLEEIGQ